MGAAGATVSSETADAVITVDRSTASPTRSTLAAGPFHIARQSVLAGMGLSIATMGVAALGYLPPIAARSSRRRSTWPRSSTRSRRCAGDTRPRCAPLSRARRRLCGASPRRCRDCRCDWNAAASGMMPVVAGTEVRVRVRAGARREELLHTDDGWLVARVTAPAHEGRANKALCRLVAKRLGIAPSRVAIVRGARSREKLLHIDGMDRTAVDAALAITHD